MKKTPVKKTLCILLTGLAILAAASGPADAKKRAPKVSAYAPAVDLEGAPTHGEFGWILDGQGYQLRLLQLDGEERAEYIRETTGSGTDPFASPEGPPRFMTFLVELTNLGSPSLSLRVEDCWLIGGRKTKVQYPIDLQTLKTNFRMLGHEFPPAYEQAGKALLASQVAPQPGETVSGLLIYRYVSPGTRQFTVELRPVLPMGQVGVHRAPYRRVKR